MMKFSDALYAKIDAYINKSMTPEELADFETMLHQNPELAEEVKINEEMHQHYDENSWSFSSKDQNHVHSKDLEAYFKSETSKMLSSKIQNAKIRYVQDAAKYRRRKFFYYAAALVVIILLLQNIFTPSNTTENLYTRYANWENLPSLTERGQNTLLSKGSQYFKQQKYDEAINIFKTHLKENRTNPNPNVWVYLGIAHLASDQYNEAISTFDSLLKSNALDRHKAHWYKALTYLKQGNTKQTQQQLEIILKNQTYPFSKQAKALMEDLE